MESNRSIACAWAAGILRGVEEGRRSSPSQGLPYHSLLWPQHQKLVREEGKAISELIPRDKFTGVKWISCVQGASEWEVGGQKHSMEKSDWAWKNE